MSEQEWREFDLKLWLAEPGRWMLEHIPDSAGWRPASYLPAMLNLDGSMNEHFSHSWRMRRKPQPVVKWICIRTEDAGESCVTSVPQDLSSEAKKRWRQFRISIPADGKPEIEEVK